MYSHNFLPEVKIKCKVSLMNNAVDLFGFNFNTEIYGSDEVIITLKDRALDGVKMFALEYGDRCEILEPEMLRGEMAKTVENMRKKYCAAKAKTSKKD